MSKNNILVNFSFSTRASESYRILRTNMFLTLKDNENLKSILITGCSPKDGKTTVACNLAISFAVSGFKVLLVDGDLRKPLIHNIFDIKKNIGLSDILEGKIHLNHGLYKNYLVENLIILPSGSLSSQPSELLSSQKMKELYNSLIDTYDYIIFDSPSLGSIPDAQILSKIVDGTILVASSEKTKKKDLSYALHLLQMSNVRMLGTLLNNYGKNSKNYYTKYN